MLYAILCYNCEKTVGAWSKEEDEAVMSRLSVVQERLQKEGKLGPSLRLADTQSAVTLRKSQKPFVITDGPFAETKEQILGFYIIDVSGQEEALQIAKELGDANPGGSYELRPVGYFHAGGALQS